MYHKIYRSIGLKQNREHVTTELIANTNDIWNQYNVL